VNHLLNVRDKAAFLRRMMDELTGGRMSLEGDLSRCNFPEKIVLAREELGLLRRNTIHPRQDFVVLRLEPETIVPIYKQVMVAGLARATIHIQIERDGVLQLAAYDNFHPECVVTGSGINSAMLSDLELKSVLRGFQLASTAVGFQNSKP
jgi:hypothetical protein